MVVVFGCDGQTRTGDPRVMSPVRYQLRYVTEGL